MSHTPVSELPYAHGLPPARGLLRARPEDFLVREDLGYTASGAGEHVMLEVRKCALNTVDVARRLARAAEVRESDIGYAGLKDRHAVTTQWFTVNLAGKSEPDWATLNDESLHVISVARHQRKLKRGALRGNYFQITVRDVVGEAALIDERLHDIITRGVPNYFMEQRFGTDNVARALEMLANKRRMRDRHKRGIYLSALRSELFNRVLAARVQAGNWDRAMPGEVMILDGSRSFFVAPSVDAEVLRRVSEHDIHPSAPLWGHGALLSQAQAGTFEQEAAAGAADICAALEHAGVEMARRATRLIPTELSWEWSAQDTLVLTFRLPAGCYATAMLREVITA